MNKQKINSLIAQKVFGWKPTKLSYQLLLNYDRLVVHPEIKDHHPIQPPEFFLIPEDGRDRKNSYPPLYCDDIHFAFKIVEVLEQKGIMFTLMNWSYYGDKYYTAKFRNSDLVNKEWEERHSNASMAICLAALKVTEHLEKNETN